MGLTIPQSRAIRHAADEPCPLIADLPAESYAYLLGLYLGDGWVGRMRNGCFRLEIVMCDQYPILKVRCRAAILDVLPTSKVHARASTGCTHLCSYSLHWPCLFPQHGPGRKHERPIVLTDWQRAVVLDRHSRALVAGLIHSDGCRTINRVTRRLRNGPKQYEYVRYFFTNRSDDIKDIFIEACARLGVDVRPDGPWQLSVARRSSVAILESVVGPKQ